MATTMRRLLRHLFTDRARRAPPFPAGGSRAVEAAIAAGERAHSGQVCVAIEAALPLARVWSGITPRQRALEVFGFLRVWDTERNDGVLVYLLLADRDVEIVADRGIHAHVGPPRGRTSARRWRRTSAPEIREGRGGGRRRDRRCWRGIRRARRAIRTNSPTGR